MLTGKIYVRDGVYLVPSGPVTGFKVRQISRQGKDETYSIVLASPPAFPPLEIRVEYNSDLIDSTRIRREKDILQDVNYVILKLYIRTK